MLNNSPLTVRNDLISKRPTVISTEPKTNLNQIITFPPNITRVITNVGHTCSCSYLFVFLYNICIDGIFIFLYF